MSISITAHPPQLVLSRQPFAFTVHCTDAGTPLRIKANIYEKSDSDSIAADTSGNASFELSDYLLGLVTQRYKTINTPAVYTGVPQVVQVLFSSLVGTPPETGSEFISDAYYLLDGFVPKARRKALYAAYPNLLEYIKDTCSCLSWWPTDEMKKVRKSQSEFINFMQVFDTENPCDLKMSVVIQCDDGSTETMADKFSLTNVQPFSVVYFPVGHDQLGIHDFLYEINRANDTWKWATSYTVYIYNSTLDKISKQYSFQVDESFIENQRVLYVRNPFGFLEIVNCTGIGEKSASLKIETSRTDGHLLPDKVSWKIEKSDTVKVNTGHLTKEQMQWLSEMDFCEAYELIESVMHPVVFKDLGIPLTHDGDYLYNAELEYEYAYNETPEQA